MNRGETRGMEAPPLSRRERLVKRGKELAALLALITAFSAVSIDSVHAKEVLELDRTEQGASDKEAKLGDDASEWEQNQAMLDEMAAVIQHFLSNGGELPEEAPEVYSVIAERYGNTTAESFMEMHARVMGENAPSKKEVMVQKGRYEYPVLAITAEQFAGFLEGDAQGLLDRYNKEHRAEGKGGCYPMATAAKESIQSIVGELEKGGDNRIAIMNAITGHAFTLVNVEGVLYSVDFTFNQFLESTTMTPWGPEPGQGPDVGIVVMPLESSYDK